MTVTFAVDTSKFQERPSYSSYNITRVIVHGRMAALGKPWCCFEKANSGISKECRVRINHFPQHKVFQPRYCRTPLCIPREIVGYIGTIFKNYHDKFKTSLEILWQVLSGNWQ